MAVPAGGAPTEIQSGDTVHIRGGMSVDFLTGAFLKSFSVTGTTASLVFQDSTGAEQTINFQVGGTPSHTDEQYLAVAPASGAHTFVPGDFTGALGVEFAVGSHTVTAPTYTGNRLFAIARLEADPDLIYLDIGSSGFNQLGGVTKLATTITIGAETYEVWVSVQMINISGLLVEAR